MISPGGTDTLVDVRYGESPGLCDLVPHPTTPGVWVERAWLQAAQAPPQEPDAAGTPAPGTPGETRLTSGTDGGERPPAPNPFSRRTSVPVVTTGGEVAVTVYSPLGQRVKQLARGTLLPGLHRVPWSGYDFRGQRVAAGVYLIHVVTESEDYVSRVVLLDR